MIENSMSELSGGEAVLQVNALMLQAAESGNYDEVVNLEKRRRKLLAYLCSNRRIFFRSEEEFKAFIERVLVEDAALTENIERKKNEVASRLQQLRGGKKAVAAYRAGVG
ncbi:MAG: flagellar protein FliT [Methylohalobius sp. ZOD2]|nr:flagellar protein FliT [Methylothermaceae bacterium]